MIYQLQVKGVTGVTGPEPPLTCNSHNMLVTVTLVHDVSTCGIQVTGNLHFLMNLVPHIPVTGIIGTRYIRIVTGNSVTLRYVTCHWLGNMIS